MLTALRGSVLTPANLEYVAERVVERLRRARGADTRERDRRRLAQIEVEIERAIELGLRTGGLDAVTRKLAARQTEKAEVQARLAAAPAPLPDLEALRPMIRRRAADLRGLFAADPEKVRQALAALLRGERLKVGPDPERGFRVNGTGWVNVEPPCTGALHAPATNTWGRPAACRALPSPAGSRSRAVPSTR